MTCNVGGMTALKTVTLTAELLDKLPLGVLQDCQTIAGEIQRDAAVMLLDGTPPPYDLMISLTDTALLLQIGSTEMPIHFSPLRRLMIDYDLMIGAHGSALRHHAPHSRSEAIDMGRRAMHNEGAEMILKQLAPYLTADLGTARLLFTLLFLLTQRRQA
ncbi:MAG TPA: UPF0262 family protein [Alphaproteobacteria bacterium]|nr:hypothetical protein [Rhodospirillaceae bacterium]HRJ12429.1 UPF0262 family protein [Alphaproteobacteria bacterium]